MINTTSPEVFISSVGRMMRPRMNMSIYEGRYDCACGSPHNYGPHINVLAQGKWRVVMQCPVNKASLTNVKINTGFLGFGFKGFESLAGINCESEEDTVSLLYAFNNLQ